jgi:hypothetical protein
MKKIIVTLSFLSIAFVVFAQEDKSHDPQQQSQQQGNTAINPVANQFQNGNEMGWEAPSMTTIESSKLPATISSDFKNRNPNMADVTWYQYDKGYTATYQEKDGTWRRVMYDQTGKPVGTAMQIKGDRLPASTTAYLQKNYSGSAYDKVYEVTGPGGVKTYEVYVNGKWIVFDSQGNMSQPK